MLIYIIGAIAAFNLLGYLLKRASEIAEQKRAKERNLEEQKWRSIDELTFRLHPKYPPDWERRRALIFIRDDGKCRKCGRKIGNLSCSPERIFGHHMAQRLLRGAEVHHIEAISHGGIHNFENLVLICDLCHAKEHPENLKMQKRVARYKFRKTWRN